MFWQEEENKGVELTRDGNPDSEGEVNSRQFKVKSKALKESAWGNAEGEFGHPAGGG
jgi:hypothetical protein